MFDRLLFAPESIILQYIPDLCDTVSLVNTEPFFIVARRCVNHYCALGPEMRTRLVWVTGQSGAGKTTLAIRMRRELGWAHFDGDVFAHGGDAMRQEGVPTAEMRAGRSEELKSAYDDVVEKGFLAVFRGEDVPLEVWTPYYDLLGDAVGRAFAASETSVVVSMAVYPRALRTHMCAKLPSVEFVVLNEVGNCGPARKVLQAKSGAAAAGQSLRDFLVSFDPVTFANVGEDAIEEALLARCTEVTRGFEPAGEGELGVDVTRESTPDMVFAQVCRLLGI